MKLFIFTLFFSVSFLNLNSQDCGTFHLFNFRDTIVDGWISDEPKNGFYFDMTYEELTADNTGYISFALVEINGDTITNTEYGKWSYYFPFKAGDTTRYTMVLNDNFTKIPNKFIGFLVTHNPECSIPVNFTTTKIVESLDDDYLELFPNPSDKYLRLKSNKSIIKIEIFDLNGTQQLAIDNQNGIDIRSLFYGVYMLRLTYSDNTHKFTKFIKH